MSSISSQNKNPARTNRRVILVGRTGLDQILRRDGSIELIRAKDTIDAIGELSDPIDPQSPAQAIVLVAASSEPADQELAQFVLSLRLIDPDVRVLRVGAQRNEYDGAIDPNADLPAMLKAFEAAERIELDCPIELRFVAGDDQAEESVEQPNETESANQEPANENPANTNPEIVVVARNETFEHRSQGSFEDESEIHKQALSGSMPEPSSEQSKQSHQIPGSQQHLAISGPHDDQPLVEAMLAGRSVLEPAIARINLRLDREDISFTKDKESSGLPVMIGDHLAGKLECSDQHWAMSDGHQPLQHQADWLSKWIKLELQQAELRNSAFTDSLTGAWNRRYFSRFLDAAIAQSRSARQPLSLMLFDIDGFKHYNDTYGHAAGDQILIETVKLLKSVIRPSDRVCRVGGDEFVVIFYEPGGPRDPKSKPLESVYQIATRFQRQICTHRFPKLAGEALGTLTISAGLASFPWDGHDADSLLNQADMLAMESKRQGKNAITLGPGAESVCKTCDND